MGEYAAEPLGRPGRHQRATQRDARRHQHDDFQAERAADAVVAQRAGRQHRNRACKRCQRHGHGASGSEGDHGRDDQERQRRLATAGQFHATLQRESAFAALECRKSRRSAPQQQDVPDGKRLLVRFRSLPERQGLGPGDAQDRHAIPVGDIGVLDAAADQP